MERKQLSRSAPLYLKRKRGSEGGKKLATIRDVNHWVNLGNKDQGNRKNARNIGLLTENVTEERMLYARQLELGRERYKFLSSHSYEKQKFIERQNVKDRSMKKAMASARKEIEKAKHQTPPRAITIRIPQVDEASDTEQEEPIPKIDSLPNSSAGKHKNGQKKTSDIKGGGTKDIQLPKSATFSKQKPKMTKRPFYVCTSNSPTPREESKTPVEMSRKEDKLPAVNVVYNRNVSFERSRKLVSGKSRSSETSSYLRSKSNLAPNRELKTIVASTSIDNDIAEDQSMRKWAVKSRRDSRMLKFGQKFDSSITDPRYVALTNTLIPLQDGDGEMTNVKDVIAKKESLRKGSVCEKAVHAKRMHAKFIALLLENELASS